MRRDFDSQERLPGKSPLMNLCFCGLLLPLFLASCATYESVAPVRDVHLIQTQDATYYRVQRGDTLYFVAWQYEVDGRTLIELNHLSPPYRLQGGSLLLLERKGPLKPTFSERPAKVHPAKAQLVRPAKIVRSVPKAVLRREVPARGGRSLSQSLRFEWPVTGRPPHAFSRTSRGIDITSISSAPVRAAADGTVVYAGNGIRGYEYLVLIKHNEAWLSAYGHNHRIVVREGETVRRGQTIGQLGTAFARHPALHFEIRHFGKAVDPVKYLATSQALS